MFGLLLGFLAGTLGDYLIHRVIGHAPGVTESNASLLSHHALVHHGVFTKRRGLTATPAETRSEHVGMQTRAILIFLAIFLLIGVGAFLLFDDLPTDKGIKPVMDWVSLWTVVGLFLFLVTYEVLHRMHHRNLPEGIANLPGYKQLRAWHHQHHLEASARYAIVLPLWDFVFFTHKGLTIVEPERPASRPVEAAKRSTEGRRRRPTTSIQDMLGDALERAEAQMDEDDAPKTRKREKKERAKRGGSTTGGKKKGGWMSALDRAMEDELDVKVTAVKGKDD